MAPCARRSRVAATALLLCAAVPFSRHPAAQGPAQPNFRASTTLVEFTVVVEDRDGNPVTDLKPEELSVTEAGRPRAVAFFRFEGARETAAPAAPPLPRGIFSNRPEYTSAAPRNITAIVIDALNTSPQDQLTVRAQVMRYLSTISPDTRVALYRAGERVEVLHDFTSDIRSLKARFSDHAVEAAQQTGVAVTEEVQEIPDWQRRMFETETIQLLEEANKEQARLRETSNQQIQNRRSGITLRSLEILGNHLAAIPGRKSIVWITPGTPVISIGAGDPWLENYEKQIVNLAHRMATQGITVYPVEAYGIRPPQMQIGSTGTGASRGNVSGRAATRDTQSLKDMSTTPDEVRLPSAMESLAQVTGGRSLRNTNDLTAGMKAAAADLRGAYSVGFYMAQNPDNQWHTFKVQVSRPGVKVLHRQGYLGIAARQPQEWTDEDWRAAANNPLGSTAIRLDARFTLLTDSLNTIVQIPAEDLQFRPVDDAPVTELEVALAEKTPQGLLGLRHERMSFRFTPDQMADLKQVRVRFPKDWPLRPTASILRLLVRDRLTDKYGTIDVKLTQLLN